MARFHAFALLFCAAACGARAEASPHRRISKAEAKDGVLPKVDSVMKLSRTNLKKIASDAHTLQGFVVDHQSKAKGALRKEKEVLEATLAEQAAANKNEWSHNMEVRAGLKRSLERVATFRRQNKAIQDSSKVMRDTMATMQTQVGVAKEFLEQISTEVGALSPEESEALRPSPPSKNFDYFLAKERQQLAAKVQTPASFLQLSSVEEEEESEQMSEEQKLTHKLMETFDKMEEANQRALDKLHQRFDEKNTSQVERHTKLLESTARLNASWTDANTTAANLSVAKAHLNTTHMDLRNRMVGMQAFYRQLVAVMNKTLEEAEKASYDVQA